jgi:hypothetical protein
MTDDARIDARERSTPMDTTVLLVIAIFALIAVGAFAVYRRRMRLGIKGPAGMGMDLEGSNAEVPARDSVRSDRKSAIGNVEIDGAAPSTDVSATRQSQVGDVTIKRHPPERPRS